MFKIFNCELSFSEKFPGIFIALLCEMKASSYENDYPRYESLIRNKPVRDCGMCDKPEVLDTPSQFAGNRQ